MKCKSKLYSYVLMPLLCLFLVFTTFTIPTHASTTSGNEEDNLFEITEYYVRDNFNKLCRYVVRWNALISDGLIGTWNDFTTWLENSGNGDIWTQHPHSPIRVQNGVDNVEVPQEVLNVINEYVIYQIQQNPLPYKEAYIYSYSFLNPDTFSNYNFYKATQDFIKQADGICICQGNVTGSRMRSVTISVIPRNINYAFIGSVNNGSFSNVSFARNWDNSSASVSGLQHWLINENGTVTENYTQNVWVSNVNNGATVTNTATNTLFSNLEKNELVYVFSTMNAYKHYNVSYPQPYYLTSDGLANSMSNWSVGSGTINTGTLNNANSSYSSVVNNIQNGWTAEQVLELVDRISQNGGSGSSGSGSDSDDDGWLDLGIFGDIGKAIAKVFGAIITAIATIFEEIITIVSNVSETLLQGVIFDFLSALLGWLPDEIIAVITAMFSIAVLFALIKLIREAF